MDRQRASPYPAAAGEAIVRVQRQRPCTGREGEHLVASPREVVTPWDPDDPCAELPGEVCRPVGAARVGDDELIDQRRGRVEARAQVRRFVPNDHRGADENILHGTDGRTRKKSQVKHLEQSPTSRSNWTSPHGCRGGSVITDGRVSESLTGSGGEPADIFEPRTPDRHWASRAFSEKGRCRGRPATQRLGDADASGAKQRRLPAKLVGATLWSALQDGYRTSGGKTAGQDRLTIAPLTRPDDQTRLSVE